MKKLPMIALLVVLAACNSAPSSPAAAPAKDSVAAVKPIKSPYEIMYSSKFEIDDPKNAETLLALWKTYDDGDLSKVKDMVADSIEMNFSDGAKVKASRDSATAMMQAVRSSFKSAVDQVNAVIAVKSVDKNEHWALIWGIEKNTHKNGKMDSTEIHEVWRFNSGGKADLFYEFGRSLVPPSPSKKK